MTKMRKMGRELSRENLQGKLLDNLDFSNSRFVQSDLQRVVFRNSSINNANLYQALLQEADLTNAQLVASDLIEANLSNAKLVSSNLRHSKLDGVNFDGADLTNADLKFATGYTAGQLSEARSLYRTTGIHPNVAAELRESHPDLFTPPPGFVVPDHTPTATFSFQRSVFGPIGSLFSRSKN